MMGLEPNAPVNVPVGGIKPTRQRHLLSFILLITVMVTQFDRVNVSVLIADPQFLADMGIVGQPMQMGLLMSAFLIAYGISTVLLGPLGDYLGPRKAMGIAILCWVISLVLGGLAPYFMLLVVTRVLLGIGEAMHFPQQSTFVKSWFPPGERGKANSIWQVGIGLAPALAMPMIAAIVYYVNWRFSFFFLAGLGLIPLALIWFCTADTPLQHKKINKAELNYIEAGLAKEREAQDHLEKRTYAESIKAVLANYKYWLVVIFYAAHCSVYYGALSWLPAYLKTSRGFSWAAMGALSSMPFILMIIMKILCGYLMDKYGRRAPMLLTCMVGAGAGIYLSVQAADNMLSALLITAGIGFLGLGGPACFTLLQDLVPANTISTSAGILTGFGKGVSGLVPVAVGFVIALTGHTEGGIVFLSGIAAIGAAATLILTLQKH
jgi:sugar phosphate permease